MRSLSTLFSIASIATLGCGLALAQNGAKPARKRSGRANDADADKPARLRRRDCARAFIGIRPGHAARGGGKSGIGRRLRTFAGIALKKGQWRYSDAAIANAPFRLAGADRKPSGQPDTTYRLEPAATGPAFDDSSWRTITPESLGDRRGPGKVSLNWYRPHRPQNYGKTA